LVALGMDNARQATTRLFTRHNGLWIALAIFVALIVIQTAISPVAFSYFDFSYQASGGAVLALAAMGQTMVVLSGGFDLSAGATISLVNVVCATFLQDSATSQLAVSFLAILLGAGIGAFNGFFVAVLRMQPIVVTLSTMFILNGVTLLVMERPGGYVPQDFSTFLNGDAIPGVLPAPVVVILAALAVWTLVKRTRFGIAIYAVGSDAEAASHSGVPVVLTKFFTYTLAGAFYGAAGVFLTAQTGGGDPLVGDPLLLPIFAAVVLGGTLLGGGRGGCLGSVVGAYILMTLVNLLLALDVPSFFSTIAEGLVLLAAVLVPLAGRATGQVPRLLRAISGPWGGRDAAAPAGTGGAFVNLLGASVKPPVVSWFVNNRENIRYSAPAFVALFVVLGISFVVFGDISLRYVNSLFVLSAFLIVLALGQGTVILTGGLDLSVPWTITFCAVVLNTMTAAADAGLPVAVVTVLLIGAAIGAFNGIGVALLGLPPLVVTLATNGIVQGLTLIYSNGNPSDAAAPFLRYLMVGRIFGFAPIVWILLAFIAGGVLLLGRTSFGRRIYAVGSNAHVAFLSGVNVAWTTAGAYVLSGVCAALVAILLSGFIGQASLGMGDEFMLPSVAVVVVGGALITGGRGHYIGMVGGALLLTAVQILLAGTGFPLAVRQVIFGMVILAAVLSLRERGRR
jgi:ribose transport system permease protein